MNAPEQVSATEDDLEDLDFFAAERETRRNEVAALCLAAEIAKHGSSPGEKGIALDVSEAFAYADAFVEYLDNE